jgi:hypothetical protein
MKNPNLVVTRSMDRAVTGAVGQEPEHSALQDFLRKTSPEAEVATRKPKVNKAVLRVVRKARNGSDAVYRAVSAAVNGALNDDVRWAVNEAAREAAHMTLYNAVWGPVWGAVYGAVDDHSHPALQDFLLEVSPEVGVA